MQCPGNPKLKCNSRVCCMWTNSLDCPNIEWLRPQIAKKIRDAKTKMAKIIESKCKCGEKISVETHLKNSCRPDGKRPFYPDESEAWQNVTVFRCRKCRGWISDTCEDAVFENK